MKRAIAFAMTLVLVAALMSVALAGSQSNTELCLLRLEPYVDIVRDAGLYPSVYLAQALLETGHCSSPAINYNNFWGIKCRDDLCFAKDTWEVYDGKRWEGKALFQVFYTARAGTEAYCRKILYQYEYRNVEYASRGLFIDSLARVWALDPDYSKKLRNIIDRYGLTKYDRGDR